MKRFIAAIALLAFVAIGASSASAAWFAHVETGQALDVQENATQADYLKRFAPQLTAGWVVDQVPAGTVHGATLNGDGTYTNPAPSPAPVVHPSVSVTDFKKRLTFAERTAILGSTDAGVKTFLDELSTASEVHLDDGDTVSGINYLVSIGLLTQARATQILTP